ncbi:hypothetical protein HanOQP8_Chr03g0121571 [Helianthus annuus]|nr:hypothetical protein HanOQP8_Chr03g0121571 [Helianthus annuus]
MTIINYFLCFLFQQSVSFSECVTITFLFNQKVFKSRLKNYTHIWASAPIVDVV